jgi:hypothetical protein
MRYCQEHCPEARDPRRLASEIHAVAKQREKAEVSDAFRLTQSFLLGVPWYSTAKGFLFTYIGTDTADSDLVKADVLVWC